MEFRVIFSPHDEFLIQKRNDFTDLLVNMQVESVFTRNIKTRILPEKGNIGIHILDLYREKTGDYDVGINDIPPVMGYWNDNKKYIEVNINEETARSSGRFLEYDTFYCHVSWDIMRNFESVDVLDPESENRRLFVSVDKNKLLDEWINQEYPEKLSPPNKTGAEELETE